MIGSPRKKYQRATQRLQNAVTKELHRGVKSRGAASVWIGDQSAKLKYIVSVVNPGNPELGDVMRINPNASEILFFVRERWDWVNADPARRCFGMWEDDDEVAHLDINLALPHSLEHVSFAYRAARHFSQAGIWNGRKVKTVQEFGSSLNPALHESPLTEAELERIYFPLKGPTTV